MNEEAVAHVGLQRHRGKKKPVFSATFVHNNTYFTYVIQLDLW